MLTPMTLFQQRWRSKTLARAYHGDFINEKIFKRWYVPSTLPDVRPKVGMSQESVNMAQYTGKYDVAERQSKKMKQANKNAIAPVGSLMFTEVERRIDVIIFRACLAHSVYEARRLVIHGDVLLNGKKVRDVSRAYKSCLTLDQHTNANTRLAPGDMVSVDPKAIRFLRPDALTSKSSPSEDSGESASTPDVATTPLGSDSVYAKTHFKLPPFAAPWIFIPAYLEVSFPTCSLVYLREPTARPEYSEIPTPYDADGEIMRLTWEWYAKRHTRMRSRTQLARMPENRGFIPAE